MDGAGRARSRRRRSRPSPRRIDARVLSSLKDAARRRQRGCSRRPTTRAPFADRDRDAGSTALHDALYAAKICCYAQGMALIAAGSDEVQVEHQSRARWRASGRAAASSARACSTRSAQAFTRESRRWRTCCSIRAFARELQARGAGLAPRRRRGRGGGGIPVPALGASLAYFDSYRTARLPQNLTQAQRDAFGAHTFERVERPGFVHADWGVTHDRRLRAHGQARLRALSPEPWPL